MGKHQMESLHLFSWRGKGERPRIVYKIRLRVSGRLCGKWRCQTARTKCEGGGGEGKWEGSGIRLELINDSLSGGDITSFNVHLNKKNCLGLCGFKSARVGARESLKFLCHPICRELCRIGRRRPSARPSLGRRGGDNTNSWGYP